MAPPPSYQMASMLPGRQRSHISPRTAGGTMPRSPRFPTSKRGEKSSMFVIDPRTLATRLLVRPSMGAFEDTGGKLVSLFVWAKNASEKWFSHVFLLLALIIYAFIGGAIFHNIEGDFEQEQNKIIRELHEPIANITDSTVEELWLLRNRFRLPPDYPPHIPMPKFPPVDDRFKFLSHDLLDEFERVVMRQCEKRFNQSIENFAESDEWNFMGSVFFSMTVFTTIGYGDKPPKTTSGKVAAMIYSFIGIPLLLIVLADLGKIFTRWIKFGLLYIRRLYYDKSLRQVRRATRAARIQAAIMDTLSKMQRPPPFFIDPITGRLTMWPSKPQEANGDADIEAGQSPIRSVHSSPVSLRRAPRVTFSAATPSPTTPDTPMPSMIDFEEIDEEFNLPVSLALVILLLYLLLGAILFWASENWTLFHAFYFVFISMSTIGFGDFVPSRVNVLMYAFIYLLFGLALTSMCINVIQEKLSSTFEKARLTIGETIGLDPTTPITFIEPKGDSSKESSKDNSRRSSQDDLLKDGPAKGKDGKVPNGPKKTSPSKDSSKANKTSPSKDTVKKIDTDDKKSSKPKENKGPPKMSLGPNGPQPASPPPRQQQQQQQVRPQSPSSGPNFQPQRANLQPQQVPRSPVNKNSR